MENFPNTGDLSPQAPLPDGSTQDAQTNGVSNPDVTPSAPIKAAGDANARKANESQPDPSITPKKSAKTPRLDNAIIAKAKESDAMRSLMRLLPYIMRRAGSKFSMSIILHLLKTFIEPRYDAAMQILGGDGDEAAEQMMLTLLSEHLEQSGLAIKTGSKCLLDHNLNDRFFDCFETKVSHDGDDFDSLMLPLQDVQHLLKRQREEEERIDLYARMIVKAQPDPLEFYRFITNFLGDGTDSDDFTEHGNSADSVDSDDE